MKNHLYELKSESLRAAQELEIEVLHEIERNPPPRKGNLRMLQQSWQAFYQRLIKRLEKENPLLLEKTGLAKPTLVVREGRDQAPRCYAQYPAIFMSPEKNPRYFMYAPESYDKSHFQPTDAYKPSQAEEEQIASLLFAGGWLGNAPIVGIDDRGCALPKDFKPTPEDQLPEERPAYFKEQYIAHGESLRQVEEYLKAKKHYDKNVAMLMEKTRRLVKKIIPVQDGQKIGSGVSFSHHEFFQNHDDSGIQISASKIQDDDPLDETTIMVPTNPYFKTIDSHGNNQKIIFRNDTVEGRRFKAAFNVLPSSQPDLSQFLGEDHKKAVLFKSDPFHILKYPDTLKHPPEDAVKVSMALMNWLDADRRDREIYITPPPMPDNLAREMRGLKMRTKGYGLFENWKPGAG